MNAPPSPTSNVTVIGGGIVGLSPIEKESTIAPHQTGYNSGVIQLRPHHSRKSFF